MKVPLLAALIPAALLLAVGGCAAAPATVDSAVVDAAGPGAWWPLQPPPDAWRPAALLVLATGDLVVADRAQNRLLLVTDGAVTLRLPAPDPAPVEWTALAPAPGLAFYALDGPGRRVHQYDVRGNYLGVAADLERILEDAGIDGAEPAGLAVDRAGRAVVTDRLGDRLLLFAPGWTFAGVWGESGDAPGSWRRPGPVTVADRAPWLVSDEGNRRVVLLDDVGAVTAVRAFPERVDAVAALGDGGFAVAHGVAVEWLDRGLATVRTATLPPGPGCRRSPWAGGLAGGGGALYVGEGCSGRIARFPGSAR